MGDAAEQEKGRDRLQTLHDAMHLGALTEVHRIVNEMHPAEIASLLEGLPLDERITIWGLVDPELDGEILTHVNEGVRATLMRDMGAAELVAATEGLDPDDLADLLPEMPDEVIQQLLNTMDRENRQRLEAVLHYREDTAGGLMNVDVITVRSSMNLEVVLRYLRRRGEFPETTDSLFVVDRDGTYLGMLPLTELLIRDPSRPVAEIMRGDVEGIAADLPATEVAKLFEHRDLVTAPVVNEEGRLLGRITIDDVVDVIRNEAEHSFMSLAGLNEEEDTFAPVLSSVRRRAVWLGVNLITAFTAASVVGQFQPVIEQLVALAVLMPIVASMGGIAGNQVLALVIRSIATGSMLRGNARWLLRKEILVGILNGFLFATLVGLVALAWFGDVGLSLIIAAAMTINLLFAASAGVIVPLTLRKLAIDPALAGPVVLTTVTDVMGFFSFLGLAALFLT